MIENNIETNPSSPSSRWRFPYISMIERFQAKVIQKTRVNHTRQIETFRLVDSSDTIQNKVRKTPHHVGTFGPTWSNAEHWGRNISMLSGLRDTMCRCWMDAFAIANTKIWYPVECLRRTCQRFPLISICLRGWHYRKRDDLPTISRRWCERESEIPCGATGNRSSWLGNKTFSEMLTDFYVNIMHALSRTGTP